MNPRAILLALAAVFVVAGLILGSRSIHADETADRVDCGSVFKPDHLEAQVADSISGEGNQDACESARSDAKPLTFGALGAGVLAFIAVFVAPAGKPNEGN